MNCTIQLTAGVCRPEKKPFTPQDPDTSDSGEWLPDVQRQPPCGVSAADGEVDPNNPQEA